MSERRCEQCENCFKHVESVYCGRAAKNCNKRHASVLLTCAKCKEVRYCSRTCQRAQWKEHKSSCLSHTRMLTVVKLLGPRIEQTFKAFSKFSQVISGYLEVPAISALELHKGKHRVNTHVFFLKIRAKETIFSETEKSTRGAITFKVESAECKTMKEMHDFLDWRAGPLATPEVTERTLAHRPGLLRLFVLDVSGLLPIPLDGYTLPTDISNWPSTYHKKYDKNWFERFLKSIGQPLRTDPVNVPMDRELSGNEFERFNEWSVPPARPSTPTPESAIEEVDAEGILNDDTIRSENMMYFQ